MRLCLAALLLATALCAPALAQQVPDPVSKTAPAAITDNKTAPLTVDGAALQAVQNTSFTANQIYQMTTPVPVTAYDAIRGIAVATAGTTTTGINGVAGYAIGQTPQGVGGVAANPVALFGVGVAATNSGWAWGLNTLLTDNTSQTVSAGTGRQLWNELDFNVTSPNTVVRGLILTGASLATPSLAVGVTVAPLGVGHPWTAAYTSQDGAATSGLALGAQSTAASSSSQLLLLNTINGAGVPFNISLQAAPDGKLNVQTTGAAPYGSFNIPAGAVYFVGGVQGVTCSGAPTAGFASVGGLVTHC